MKFINKYYSQVLTVSAVVLTAALFWFSFVYYPKIVGDFKVGRNLPAAPIFKPVSASSYVFPIETEKYRIEYAAKFNAYDVIVAGATLEEYAFNMDNAKLALKTALSANDLCGVDVVYISSVGLTLPPRVAGLDDC